MAILKVVEYGNDVLRTPAEKVHKVSAKIQKLVADMFDTMYAYNGVGLAAPQVGELKQIFVLDCSTDEQPMPKLVFINPVIVKKSGAIISRKGLSFPEVYTEVKRYETVTVRFMDMKGKTQTMSVQEGTLLCRAIQHELDHLHGILFVDHFVIDRFTTDELLAQHNLPPIQPEKILEEPELDSALQAVKM